MQIAIATKTRRGVRPATAAVAMARPIIGTYQYAAAARLFSQSNGRNVDATSSKPIQTRRSRTSKSRTSAKPAYGMKKSSDEYAETVSHNALAVKCSAYPCVGSRWALNHNACRPKLSEIAK